MTIPGNRRIFISGLLRAVCITGLLSAAAQAQNPGDWPMYRVDLAGTGYSPLAQINAENVGRLTQSWQYSLRAQQDGSGNPNSQATPVVIDDVMYLPAADRVIALDPVTGLEKWRYAPPNVSPSRRGVSYWSGTDAIAPRILFTAGEQLIALDAATGEPAPEFGTAGSIDLGIPYNSVPLVYDNIVVVGANTPRGAIGGIGNARAYDLRSGEKLWEFNSVPQPGEIGHDTWAGDSWIDRLGANVWPFYFTMDEQREHLYLPLASPIPFAYGGDREGANLFANSLVAVNIRTGEYVWHFLPDHSS